MSWLQTMKILLSVFAVLGIGFADIPDVTTIYRLRKSELNDTEALVARWPAYVDAHARGHSLGFPFQLPNGLVIGPNLDADFQECFAWYDGCPWNASDSSWTLRRNTDDTPNPRLTLGTASYTDILNNNESESRPFLENIEMVFEISESGAPIRNMTLMLEDTIDNAVYVVFHGVYASPGTEDLALYSCTTENYKNLEECTLTESRKVDAIKWLPNEKYKITVDISNEKKLKISFSTATRPFTFTVGNLILSTYKIKLSGMAGKVISRGVGAMLFSLGDIEGNITSTEYTPTSSGPDICVDIDCYMAQGTTLSVVAEVGDDEYILGKPTSMSMHSWTRVRFTTTLQGEDKFKARVLKVVATKSARDKELLIQRISSCHTEARTEDVLELEEKEYPLPIPGEGFTVAMQQLPVTSVGVSVAPSAVCRNGGFLDDGDERCNCPPGFNGTYCEEGCGPNRYGEDCGGLCSQTKRACRGMFLCRPKRTCDCAPGFHGHFCEKECTEGYYGNGCRQGCGECAAGTCNIYTGTCHQGCKPGYTLPLCQYTYRYLSVPPTATDDGGEISVDASFVDLNGDSTYTPTSYQLQYRIAGDSQESSAGVLWKKENITTYPGPKAISVGKLKSVDPGRKYQIRVVLIHEDSGSYEGVRVPVLNYTTKCEVPDSVEYKMDVTALTGQDGLRVTWKYTPNAEKDSFCSVAWFEIHVKLCWQWTVYKVNPLYHMTSQYDIIDLLQGESYQVKMRAMTSQGAASFSPSISTTVRHQAPIGHVNNVRGKVIDDSCRVQWDPPRHVINNLDHYNVTYECIRLLACPENKVDLPEACEVKNEKTDNQSIRLYNMVPYAKYNISVYAVDKSGFKGPSHSIQIITDSQEPNVVLSSSDQEPTRDESSVTVFWKTPDEDNCVDLHGAILGYSCDIQQKRWSSWGTIKSKTTFLPQVTFDDLEPSTEYRVQVRVMTTAGKTDTPLPITVNTTAPSPNPVGDLEVYKRTSTSLGVRWSDPSPADNLRSFTVKVFPSENTNSALAKQITVKYEDARCGPWPDKNCKVITGLEKYTLYNIEVVARNNERDKDGKPSFVEKVMTNETRPGPPSDLIMKSSNATSITLQWNIPKLLNSDLKYFMASAEYIGPDPKENDDEDSFETLKVYEERATYSMTITKLTPGSNYFVSVSAYNKKEAGPAINGTFSTQL